MHSPPQVVERPWRNKVLKDTAMLNGAAVVAQLAATAQSLAIMRLLGPATYGIWLGLTIILTYGGLSHFGAEHGMGIRLPYFRGKGQDRRARAMADSVFIAWTVSAVLIASGVAIFAVMSKSLTPLVRDGLLAIALLLPLNQQATFYSRWQGAALTDFKLSSILSVVQGWASLVIVVPLAIWLGLKGVMMGSVAVAFLVYLIWRRGTAYRFQRRWSIGLLWQAVRVGFPMTLVVLGGGLIQTIDRIVILSLLGARSLGYYGVTSLGGGVVYGLISQAGSAMGPHITVEMGRSADSPRALERFLVTPTIVFAYVSTFAIALLIVVIPPLVALLLPKYNPGLRAFLIYIPGFYFLSIILTANTILTLILIARRQQRIVLYVQGGGIAIEAGLAFALIKAGFGLEGAALASTTAYAFYGIGILYLAAKQVLQSRRAIVGFLGRVLTPAFVVFPLIIAAHVWADTHLTGQPATAIALQLALLAATAGVLFRTLDRQVGVAAFALDIRDTLRRRVTPGS
jgi:O-antigen/teichoic acid export membrane protein